VDEAIIANLGFGAEDLTVLRTEVGRPVEIEVDVWAEPCQLHFVQPSGVHFDVQSKEDAQRCVALDVDGSPGALDHRAGPRLGWRRRAEHGDENEKKQG
jgi:hypothetical protein